jgi:hypothetical protein
MSVEIQQYFNIVKREVPDSRKREMLKDFVSELLKLQRADFHNELLAEKEEEGYEQEEPEEEEGPLDLFIKDLERRKGMADSAFASFVLSILNE